jgi:hypothetical protein
MNATKTGTLYSALELGQDKWLIACATQAAGRWRPNQGVAADRPRLQSSRGVSAASAAGR